MLMQKNGTIYSLKKNRDLKFSLDKDGYLTTTFRLNNIKQIIRLHQIIWVVANRCDIPVDENGNSYHIHHIDGNKQNNSIYNLELLSHKEHNEKHKIKQPLTKEVKDKIKQNSPLKKKVGQYTLDGKLIKIWESTREIERCLGFNHCGISSCCINRKYHKTYKGYIWKYL